MKIAVYTCVVGGYDRIREPLVKEKECDYFLITDVPASVGNIWQWIEVDTVVPDPGMCPRDKNRYCKMNPHKLFGEYDYSIYLDGSIQIVEPVARFVENVGITGIAAHRHRADDCVYSEAIFLSWLGAVDPSAVRKDMERYMQEGFPRHYGLFECGVLVTDLRNPMGLRLYREWYGEYLVGSKRDQQALVFTLWRMGLDSTAIGDLECGKNIYTNPAFNWDRSAHYK